MLRQVLLTASRNDSVKRLIETAPVSRSVVNRFVAGDAADDAVRVTDQLLRQGLQVSLDRLGEDTLDAARAAATSRAYANLLNRLATAGLSHGAEVSVKLSAVGLLLPTDGEQTALENARAICDAAKAAGTTVTLDMEDHTTTDATLSIARELRRDFPWLGVVIQAYLRRSEADCRDLAHDGCRVRLCKGAYKEPASVAYQSRAEVDLAYVRCAKILMAGSGYPMIATHDPRLIEIAGALAVRDGRMPSSYEYQMLYGIRPREQRRLSAAGETLRVYLPYGDEWYGYCMRRLAERPANVTFFLRSLVTRG